MYDFRFVSRHLPPHSTATLAALPAMSLIPLTLSLSRSLALSGLPTYVAASQHAPFAPFRFLICEVFTAEDAENTEPT